MVKHKMREGIRPPAFCAAKFSKNRCAGACRLIFAYAFERAEQTIRMTKRSKKTVLILLFVALLLAAAIACLALLTKDRDIGYGAKFVCSEVAYVQY